ncbi:unnamed protein product, partial [Adineta steineri]
MSSTSCDLVDDIYLISADNPHSISNFFSNNEQNHSNSIPVGASCDSNSASTRTQNHSNSPTSARGDSSFTAPRALNDSNSSSSDHFTAEQLKNYLFKK